MMRSGFLSELPTLKRPTRGSGSSWSRGEYPTPTATSYGSSNNGSPHDGREEYATKGSPSLQRWAQDWPTASATDAKGSRRHGYMLKGNPGTTLTDAMLLFLAQETRKAGERSSSLAVLNPAFVEALMGLPNGWTDVPGSVPSATRSSRKSARSSGK